MQIKILKPVRLDIDGKGFKIYGAGEVLEVEDIKYVESNNLVERYSKFPNHIMFVEKNELDYLSVAELKELCFEKGIEFGKKARKKDLIALLSKVE